MKADLVTIICDMLVHVVDNIDTTQGICGNLRYVGSTPHDTTTIVAYALAYREISNEMRRHAVHVWRHDSYVYPIPHPTMHCMTAYHEADMRGSLWDSATEYGRNRWTMLAHLCEWASNLPVD